MMRLNLLPAVRLLAGAIIGLLVSTSVWLAPRIVFAQVAIQIEGQNAETVRKQILKMLPEGFVVIEPAAFTGALGREQLGEAAGKPSQQQELVQELAAAGKQAGAILVVAAMVRDGGTSLWVLTVRTDTASVELDETYSIRKRVTKGKKRRRQKVLGPFVLRPLKQALGPVVEAAAQEAAARAQAATGVGQAANDGEASAKTTKRTTMFDREAPQLRKSGVSCEPRFFIMGRKLSFLRRGDNLRGYRANAIPMLGANAELYPGVLFGIDLIDWLGVGFRFATAVGLSSQPRNDTSLTIGTSYWTVEADVRPRFSFGPVTLAGAIGFGGTTFEFSLPSGSPLSGQTPGVSYAYLRTGFDALAIFGPVSVLAGAAYLHNFSVGTLGSYFPNRSSFGITFNLGGAFQILDWLEVRAGFEYTQIGHSFHPDPGAAYQAQSATDHLYGGRLGVVVFYPP